METETSPDATQQFRATFMTEHTSYDLNIDFKPEAAAPVVQLLSIFGTVDEKGVSIAAVQTASPKLKQKLADYVAAYGRTMPILNRLAKMVRDLKDDAFFLMVETPASSTAERLRREQFLHRLNNPESPEEELAQVNSLFDKLLENYEITQPRTDKHTAIGRSHKPDRVCRFCHRNMSDGATFEEGAHAISAALGNKFLKLNEECDTCNHHFGENVEPSLIEMLNVQRVFLGTEARGAKPRITFVDGKMYHDGKQIIIQATNISDPASGPLNLSLKSAQQITPLNIYKSLAKFALSVINETELPSLKSTIEWVRFDKHGDKPLPKIASAIIFMPPSASAQITLYVRREGAPSALPHVVCEFRLGCFYYVYALPFSEKDKWDLIEFFDEPTFRDVFKHYNSVSPWTIEDFSSSVAVSVVQNIRFAKKEDNENV